MIRKVYKNSPDVCIFINSLKRGKKFKKEKRYFKDLKNSRIAAGILLKTVMNVLDRWVNDISNAIISFRRHCRETSSKWDVYLEHIRNNPRNIQEKRLKRYDYWIEWGEKENKKDEEIMNLRKKVRRKINKMYSIFSDSNIKIKCNGDKKYFSKIYKKIKKETELDDKEDSNHFACLSLYLNSLNKPIKILFVTADRGIYENSGDINSIDELNQIYPINIKDFYSRPPSYIKN